MLEMPLKTVRIQGLRLIALDEMHAVASEFEEACLMMIDDHNGSGAGSCIGLPRRRLRFGYLEAGLFQEARQPQQLGELDVLVLRPLDDRLRRTDLNLILAVMPLLHVPKMLHEAENVGPLEIARDRMLEDLAQDPSVLLVEVWNGQAACPSRKIEGR